MKQTKYFLFLIAGVLVLSSCKKELDKQPTDSFSDANAFLTMDDIQQGANAAYRRFGNGNFDDINVNTLLSDEAKLGPDNSGGGALTYRYQYGSNNTSGSDVIAAWGDYYTVIDQVNRVLPKIPTVTATAAQEPRRAIVQAQLIALRGISLFGLLQSYSKNYDPTDARGVPIILASNPLGKPARNSVADVMAQIQADLSNAKAALPAVTAATFSDTVMNKLNIAAYQARIALYMHDYDGAVNYANEVISSGIKPLVTGSAFAGIWTDVNTNEILFRIRYATSSDGTIGALWTATGGQILIAPSDKLVASYDPADIRLPIYIGTDGAGDNYVNKFYASSRGGRVLDLKACRIAEMWLILAEADAKKASPDVAGGTLALNTLRLARISGYTPETFASAQDLIDAVLTERYKELAFEGFRFFDLKRNNLPVQRLASDAGATWQTLAAGSTLFVLPIPSDEIAANPNIVQNAGY